MKKQFSKFLSLLMATLLVFSTVPAALTVFAVDAGSVLTLGEEYVIEATEDEVYLTFTPTETGYYAFYSESDYDLVGKLYNGEDEVAYDDDGGSYNNFQIVAYLSANTEYTLNVHNISDGLYNCSVFVEKSDATVKDLKIIQGDSITVTPYHQFGLNAELAENSKNVHLKWEYDPEYLSFSYDGGLYEYSYIYFVPQKIGTTTVKAICGHLEKTITVVIEDAPESQLGTVKNIIFKNHDDSYATKYTITEAGWYNLSYEGEHYAYFQFNCKYGTLDYVEGNEINRPMYLTPDTYYLIAGTYHDFDIIDYTFKKCEEPSTESKFHYETLTMPVGTTRYLDYDSNQYCWLESSNEEILYVENNEIYAYQVGEATVTMYGYDENEDTIVLDTVKVTVTDGTEIKLDTKTSVDLVDGGQLYKFVVPADGEYIFSTADVVSGDYSSSYHSIRVFNEDLSVDDYAGNYANGIDLAVDLKKDDVIYIECNYNSAKSHSLIVRNEYNPLTSIELIPERYSFYDSETDTYYFMESAGTDMMAYGSTSSSTNCITVYFEYDNAFNYDTDYTITAISGDKNVISDRDEVYSEDMYMFLEGIGETTLTVTYKDNETGKEFSDTINVVVLSDVENDVNNDGVFDEFDVGAALDIYDGEESTLPQYVRCDFDDDNFFTDNDIINGILAMTIDETDKTPIVIEGAEDGKTYTEKITLSVRAQDFNGWTLNDEFIVFSAVSDEELGFISFSEFEIEPTEEDREYTVIAMDVNGNITTITFTMAGNLTLGDVNNSGDIDMMDYILIKRNYFGTFQFTDAQIKAGDVNKSGDIDMMDYILIKRAYFGTFTLQ